MAAAQSTTIGPDVVVPGSQQLAPVFFGLITLIALIVVAVSLLRRRRRAKRGLPPRRRVALSAAVATALVAGVLTAVNLPPPFFVPRFAALPRLLPAGAFFYRPIGDLPVSADNERWHSGVGSVPLRPAFAGTVGGGIVWGIPFNLVSSSTPTRDVSIKRGVATSYPGPYPISDPAYIQSMPTYGFDQHYIAVDLARHRMWELGSAREWFGRWEADYGALWKLDELSYGHGSTIAAGLPLLPGTITYDQVASGRIGHTILAGLQTTGRARWIWPAKNSDGRSTDPSAPPQGAWLRLRADADLSGLGPQARVIARAMRDHGVVLSDTGPGFYLRGTPDARWDDADLDTLRTLSIDDFDFVDASGIMVSPDSMAARPAA